jgi:glucose 1-dehydrogenase
MKGLKGKNVLVTGATSGIGQAMAVRMATEGANVAINYRKKPEKADETLQLIEEACSKTKTCEGRNILVDCDVSNEEQIVAMVEKVVAELGGIDILINNAGIQISSASELVETADFDKVISVNLRGAYLCAREAIKHFLKQENGGVIINVSSVREIIPRPEYISYSISKGGMENLTKTLALEYAERQIRVNAIGPGATATDINKSWTENPQKEAKVASNIPMQRVGTPL